MSGAGVEGGTTPCWAVWGRVVSHEPALHPPPPRSRCSVLSSPRRAGAGGPPGQALHLYAQAPLFTLAPRDVSSTPTPASHTKKP